MYDLQTATTTLVSRQSAADGAAGGDGSSTDAWPSSDGRYVAFQSDANNLSTLDNNAVTNIFVRDVLGAPAIPPGGGGGSTGGGTPTVTPPGPTPQAPPLAVVLAKRPVVLKGRNVLLRVSCPASTSPIGCNGRVKIYIPRSVLISRRSRPQLLLAQGRVKVTAGRKKTIKARLSRRARPLVLERKETALKRGRHKVRVSFNLSSPDGRKRTVNRTRKLKVG